MIKTVKLIALILALTALISLCACTSADSESDTATSVSDTVDAAGTYTYYAHILDGHYVYLSELEGRTTTLNADGSGALDWGDDNKGPISEWTIDGENVVIKAGVAEMNATLKDGILTIDMDNDTMPISLVCIKEGADTSSIPVMTKEEYAAMFADN